jgi:hypothetical protein
MKKMKKLLILSLFAASFAACNSSPEQSESAMRVEDLGKWVDSIKNLVSSSSTFDSATWSGYSEGFNTANEGINATELDEASTAAYSTLQNTWEGIGESYRSGIENSKKAALEAAAMDSNKADTTAAIELPLKSNK